MKAFYAALWASLFAGSPAFAETDAPAIRARIAEATADWGVNGPEPAEVERACEWLLTQCTSKDDQLEVYRTLATDVRRQPGRMPELAVEVMGREEWADAVVDRVRAEQEKWEEMEEAMKTGPVERVAALLGVDPSGVEVPEETLENWRKNREQ